MIDETDEREAIPINEIGQFEGETSVQLEGLFYITVEADGNYLIEMTG